MNAEQKQALIEHAKSWIADCEAMRDEIPFGFDGDTEKELSLIKIALAALTAPPLKLPDIEENHPAFNAGLNALIDCLEDCGDAEQGLRLALRAIRSAGYEVQE